MGDKLISVIMPAYNHEMYVGEAIRSILGQGWPRVELVVIDDGSSDGTWSVLQQMLPECRRRCERVVMRRQANRGTCETMNRLWAEAHGDYVAPIASDDAYLPGAFTALAEPFGEDPSVGLVVGQCEWMDEHGRQCFWDADRHVSYQKGDGAFSVFNEYLAEKTGVSSSSPLFGTYPGFLKGNHIANGYMVRRSFFEQILPYTRDAPLEDYWSHLQLSKIARYVEVPEHVFRYRWHSSNTMRDDAHVCAMCEKTLAHEESVLIGARDWRRFAQYLELCATRVSRKSILGMASSSWYGTSFSAIRVLTAFGRVVHVRRIMKHGRT